MRPRTLKNAAAVRDLIRKVHPLLKRKFRAALKDILDDPNCGKPLKDELEGLWSLRVGGHRIVYRPDESGAEIVAIGPRTTIYEETAQLVLRDRRQRQITQTRRRKEVTSPESAYRTFGLKWLE